MNRHCSVGGSNFLTWIWVLFSLFISTSAEGINLSRYMQKQNDMYQSFKNISLPFDANIVNTIYQDSQGMMWLGTRYGLFNYNGYDLHECVNASSRDENSVYAIIQTDEKHLCLGTDRGVLWYDLQAEQWETSYQGCCMSEAIRSLAWFDEKLWIGTRDKGLYTYDFREQSLSQSLLPGKHETVIYALEPAGDKLFVGSYESLSYYEPGNQTRTLIELPGQNNLMVNSLLWDEAKRCVWIGTEGFLFSCDMRSGTLVQQSFLTGASFKSLAIDDGGNLLLGTDDGLYVYQFADGSCRLIVHDSRNPHSLCNNIIWDIACDKEKNIWLATDRGISLAHARTEYNFIHLAEIVSVGDGNSFTWLRIDSHGDYWLGGDSGLIHIGGEEQSRVEWFKTGQEAALRHNRIRRIYEDSDRLVWIATDGGIARYDRRQGRFIYYAVQDKSGQKNSNWAYDIFEDKFGKLWIATYLGGLFVVDKEKLLAHRPEEPFTELVCHLDNDNGLDDFVFDMQYDGQDSVWVNTQKGLASVCVQTFQVSYKNMYIDNLLYDNSTIWYSLQGSLYRYDIPSGRSEKIPNIVGNRAIYALVKEGNRLWFSSTSGLACMDVTTGRVRNLLSTGNYYQAGVYDERNNVIWWGGKDGLVCFSPDQVEVAHQSQRVYITAISANGNLLRPGVDYEGNSLRFQEEIKLRHPGNLVLELSSFTYQDSGKETFYYRLNDEDSWQPLQQNQLMLSGLSGGRYLVRLSNASPANDKDAFISTFTIVVPYPWYVRWYAWVAYACLLAGALYLFIRDIQQKNREKYERHEREKSMELSRMKMDFFVDMSHELKTPLSLIIAPLSKLMAETTDTTQRAALTGIHTNALRLNTLIYKILNFKQLEDEGENALIRSHVELCTLLQGCIHNFSAVLEERRIELSYASDTPAIWLNLDKLKMESVFINLLSNAIKYVPEQGGKIAVFVQKQADKVCVRVSDNGMGIAENDLPLIFVRFFQGKNKNRHSEGTGIGLYLVKKFVELHKGHVQAWNDGGLTVEITLPLIGENVVLPDESGENPAPVASSASLSTEVTILIIDDNAEMVAFLAESLSGQYRCLKAYDGKEGMKVVRQQKPDLVIVDQMMPEMDGMEFCRQLRRYSPAASVPVIMLTAKDNMETELESIRAGIDVFIPKPFDLKKLLLRITQLLQKRSLLEKSIRIETIAQPDFEKDIDKRTSDEVLLEKVTRCIEESLSKEDFNVSALAESVGIDQKQLYRKVKQLTGMTPVSYIRKLKMKKAAVLLAQKKFTVSEVMFLVGYTNASHFTKNFSEEFGVTPKQFERT